jgi:hypothetical protein
MHVSGCFGTLPTSLPQTQLLVPTAYELGVLHVCLYEGVETKDPTVK